MKNEHIGEPSLVANPSKRLTKMFLTRIDNLLQPGTALSKLQAYGEPIEMPLRIQSSSSFCNVYPLPSFRVSLSSMSSQIINCFGLKDRFKLPLKGNTSRLLVHKIKCNFCHRETETNTCVTVRRDQSTSFVASFRSQYNDRRSGS